MNSTNRSVENDGSLFSAVTVYRFRVKLRIVHTSHISWMGECWVISLFFFSTKHTIMLDLQLLGIFFYSTFYTKYEKSWHRQQITCNLYSTRSLLQSKRGTRLRTLTHTPKIDRQAQICSIANCNIVKTIFYTTAHTLAFASWMCLHKFLYHYCSECTHSHT